MSPGFDPGVRSPDGTRRCLRQLPAHRSMPMIRSHGSAGGEKTYSPSDSAPESPPTLDLRSLFSSVARVAMDENGDMTTRTQPNRQPGGTRPVEVWLTEERDHRGEGANDAQR